MKILLTLLVFTLSAFANSAFIQAQDLYSKLNDKNLVIVDTTNQQNYEQGHITNARRADISAFRHWVDKTYLLMNSPDKIQSAARELGINNDSYVVLYGHNNPKELLKASYIALALIVHGFENVSILDGGFSEWKNKLLDKEDAVSLQIPTYNKGNFTAKYNPSVLVDMQYVKEKVGKTAMIEARPKKFYDGSAQSPGVKRLGHISGAKSSFWLDKFNKDEMLQDDKKLKKIFFEENSLDANQEVITYCTGGLEASMNWYILTQYLNFKNVKLYDASMKEWGNLENTPMQK
jgi:thiosulfate/3-mercaptopyruvate sulfurtransferase